MVSKSRYSSIAVPHDLKKALEERAGDRPIFRMLAEDFLGEPDTDKLIETKFKVTDEKLDAINDAIEKISSAIIDIENTIDTLIDDISKRLSGHDESIRYLATRQSVLENALKDGLPINSDAITETTGKLVNRRQNNE